MKTLMEALIGAGIPEKAVVLCERSDGLWFKAEWSRVEDLRIICWCQGEDGAWRRDPNGEKWTGKVQR